MKKTDGWGKIRYRWHFFQKGISLCGWWLAEESTVELEDHLPMAAGLVCCEVCEARHEA